MHKKSSFYVLTLIVITAAVYYPVLGHDFLYQWDDGGMMNRYTEGGINFDNFWAILTEFYYGQYSPVSFYIYAFVYSLFGYDTVAFHSVNYILHIINVLCLYSVIKYILVRNPRIKFEHAPLIAFISALLFAIHPFNVETVSWVSTIKITSYAFFYIAATCAFLKYLENVRIRYYIFTLIFFIFSFGAKEQAVTFPLWMLMLYWIFNRSLKERKVWFQVVPFFLLSIVFGIITILSQSGGNSLLDQTGYPIWQRIVYACYSFSEYLLKLVFPFKLSYIYPFPSVAGEPMPTWLLLYPSMLTVLLLVCWKWLIENKIVLFCLLYVVVHLILSLHLISISRFAVVADRYAYIASIGVCFMIAYYAVYFIQQLKGYKKYALYAALSAYILYFGIYSNVRCRVWQDTDTLKKELRELLKERDDYDEMLF